MKRLLILTAMMALVAPLAGCSNGWPRLWCFRGDPCNVAPMYQSLPAVTEEYVAPPAQGTEVLPGPARTESST